MRNLCARSGPCLFLFLAAATAAGAQEASPTGESPWAVAILMRWIHILTAIVVAGGSIFMRLILLPAAAQALDADAQKRFRAAIVKRWRMIVHAGIVLFLLSGLYNYLVIGRHLHVTGSPYHMLFGIKFLLALVLFALAVGLSSSSRWSAPIRARAPMWMGVLVGLAIMIVLIAGYMKVMP